jgi:hypothetical protein
LVTRRLHACISFVKPSRVWLVLVLVLGTGGRVLGGKVIIVTVSGSQHRPPVLSMLLVLTLLCRGSVPGQPGQVLALTRPVGWTRKACAHVVSHPLPSICEQASPALRTFDRGESRWRTFTRVGLLHVYPLAICRPACSTCSTSCTSCDTLAVIYMGVHPSPDLPRSPVLRPFPTDRSITSTTLAHRSLPPVLRMRSTLKQLNTPFDVSQHPNPHPSSAKLALLLSLFCTARLHALPTFSSLTGSSTPRPLNLLEIAASASTANGGCRVGAWSGR